MGGEMCEYFKSSVSTPVNLKMSHLFSNVIIYGKFALLALLLIASFINGHKEYIAENPRKFMWDNFLVGGLSALAMVFIALGRGRSDVVANVAFISFLLFFAYNVFREMSGFNRITDSEKLSQAEAVEAKVIKPIGLIVVVVGAIALSLIAWKVGAGHPMGWGVLLREAAILGGLTAIAEMIVAKNHDEPGWAVILNGFINFSFFFGGHIVLQYGGFYNHIFDTAGVLNGKN